MIKYLQTTRENVPHHLASTIQPTTQRNNATSTTVQQSCVAKSTQARLRAELSKLVNLPAEEQKKYEVIKKLVDHPQSANKKRAALSLECTLKDVNRLIAGYKKYGKQYNIYGNKGKTPAIAFDKKLKEQIIELYKEKYTGANFTHFTELLRENEGIHISVSSVVNILESQYILSPRVTRAKRKRVRQELKTKQTQATTKAEKKRIESNIVAIEHAHSRRPRCAYFGELQQMDATPHEWVTGEIWHLHVAIDDATGTITGACRASKSNTSIATARRI